MSPDPFSRKLPTAKAHVKLSLDEDGKSCFEIDGVAVPLVQNVTITLDAATMLPLVTFTILASTVDVDVEDAEVEQEEANPALAAIDEGIFKDVGTALKAAATEKPPSDLSEVLIEVLDVAELPADLAAKIHEHLAHASRMASLAEEEPPPATGKSFGHQTETDTELRG